MMQFASCFGVDAVSISDIQYSLDSFGDSYRRRVYSPKELSLINSWPGDAAVCLATLFATKEAVVKALGVTDQAFSWRDIEVLPERGATVVVNLHGAFQGLAPSGIRVALTRAGDLVLALAVVQS